MTLSIIGCAIAGVMLYLGGLATVTLTLVWACRHYQVSKESPGIRPASMFADSLIIHVRLFKAYPTLFLGQ